VDKIFRNMDRDKDAKLTYDEFVEGSKQDPTIVQARAHCRWPALLADIGHRHCHFMTALYDMRCLIPSAHVMPACSAPSAKCSCISLHLLILCRYTTIHA
jgi:hypothetical protein